MSQDKICIPLWNQEVKIVQDPKSSKSCSKSQSSQLGQELRPDLHTVKSLESSILQMHENFLETLCQYYWSK